MPEKIETIILTSSKSADHIKGHNIPCGVKMMPDTIKGEYMRSNRHDVSKYEVQSQSSVEVFF